MRIRKSAKDRRAEIEQATLTLAFEAGPERVTTGMIADRLGLSQPAIYKHFSSKNDIWFSVTKNLSAQINTNIADATRQATGPTERLRLLVLGHLQLIYRTPVLPEIMVARDPKGVQNDLRIEIQSCMAGFFSELTNAIEEAQDLGRFQADIAARDLATLIFGVIQGLVLRMLVTRNPAVLLADSEKLLELQMTAFAPSGDGK